MSTDGGPAWADLVRGAQAREPRAVARLISWVEDGSPHLADVMLALTTEHAKAARVATQVIGLTGAPGVGKSTTTSALITAYRQRGLRVGVLAIDPSSPFSGGALLGDRIRMQEHATDPGVYIRSMASRGHLGGMAAATPQAIRVLEAAGFDVVLVETVGVGQSEVEVAASADTTVVLLAPGMGDAIQAAKAGILEVGDIFCVNKADRDGADAAVREVRHMISLGEHRGWKPTVVTAVASRGDVAALVSALDERHAWLQEGDHLGERRRLRATEEIVALAMGQVRGELTGGDQARELARLAQEMLAGRLDPYSAAERLLSATLLSATGRMTD